MEPAPDAVLTVAALGVRIRLEAHGSALAAAVAEAWTDATVPDDGTETAGTLSVRLDDPSTPAATGDAVSGRDVAETLHLLSPAVTHRAIAARAGELVMLHAAALADPATGATAVLVAPSGTGKTTASRTLGQHFAYLSDETAGITSDGTVLTYRKPLSLIEGSRTKTQRSPSSLGMLLADVPCHLAAVLLVARDPDHVGEPAVEKLPTVEALAALAPETSYLNRLPQPLQRLADLCHRVGGVRRVTYREADDLAPHLHDVLTEADR